MKNSRTLFRYCGNYIKYMQWESDYHLPPYNFCPWGWRSQCYILGIMTGYLLWVTKDKKVVIDKKLNCLVWFNAISLGMLLATVRKEMMENCKVMDILGCGSKEEGKLRDIIRDYRGYFHCLYTL